MNQAIKYLCSYGELTAPGTTPVGPLADDFTLNSPVGVHADSFGRLWVCDTGNSRVLVFDADLSELLHVIEGPGDDTPDAPRLLMPFHVCPHPTHQLMYCTDMGHGRVVAFAYDEHEIWFSYAFGEGDSHYLPLSDPNGITVVRERDGVDYLYVCDEFFHTVDDLASRCVKFTLEGEFISQFRHVGGPGVRHELLWPQGLASDANGNLYLANTGHYEILKISTDWPIVDECVQAPHDTVMLHQHGKPTGIGKFNVMRSVCVIGDRVFVPGHIENAITVYDLEGKEVSVVNGLLPLWNHTLEPVHSLSDFVYGALEDVVFVGPYQICAAEGEPDVYFISEPFASSVIKVLIPRIPGIQGDEDALLIESVGHRRDDQNQLRSTSQFNCMTSVIGFNRERRTAPREPQAGGNWIDQWAMATTSIYKYWYDQFRTHLGIDPLARMENASLNIDSGNWCMKTFNTESDPYHQLQDMMRGFFVPGDLAMDVYYPHTPPLGQICPGTPIVFVTNFNMCTVTMYQFNPAGYLINYGMPFGREGVGGDGTLKAPQGIAINGQGEIYIADSLNNRISMWQIQPTGFVAFRKNFRWQSDDDFTPCDVAIDAQDRLFVCDQFNNCLRVFDREGNSLWTYGHLGYCDDVNVDYGKFMLPASVCIDGDRLIVNDLVNRALKVFRIGDDTLHYETGISVFKKYPDAGGVWMPYFIYADRGRLYVPDTTFNVVNVFRYGAAEPDSVGIAA
ncbi:NHL repeat-containing protein [Duganella sp. S19_KUP01_CR8]|uniref:NHL repeat-containing protein n=1 Tax=Duganella sp. S19_KUP01_CR8 TaxID=3025502 RepID=UPI002FCDCA2B